MRLFTTIPAVALTAMLMTFPVSATEFEDSVPLDLAKALILPSGAQVRIYSDVPDGFPAFELPEGLEVLGSVDQGQSLQLILRYEPDGGARRADLIEAFEREDFTMVTSPPARNRSQRGFVAPNVIPPAMAVQLCHDDHGLVTAQNRDYRDGDRLLVLDAVTRRGHPMSCEELAQRQSRPFNPMQQREDLRRHLPRLELPEQASRQSGASPSLRMSGGSGSVDTRTDLSIDWSLRQVYEHFAGQIAEQDWALDNESVGSISAVGSWTQETGEDAVLLGSLQIVNPEDADFQLVFTLSRLGGREQE